VAFPETELLDYFDRANEGPPPSALWVTGVFGEATGLSVVTNEVSSGSANGSGYWDVEIGPHCEVYTDVTMGDNDEVTLYTRLAAIGAGTTDGYAIWMKRNAATDYTVRLYRIDNAVATQLGGDLTITSAVTGMGLGHVNAELVPYVAVPDWLPGPGPYQVDATYTAAGKLGLRLNDVSGTLRADDFGGGTRVFPGSDRSGGTVVVGP
jgi:hypothetical protein